MGAHSFAFARAGWQAFGLDRSHVGVQHAGKKATADGLESRLAFMAGDVADAESVGALVKAARAVSDSGPVLFYMRFFLHSIPEDVQDALMSTIGALARPGDALAAEFRTEKDEATRKTFGGHYRRYQNGWAFGETLRNRLGFDVVHEEEGTGLAPYKNEDPVLYRVVATKPDAA